MLTIQNRARDYFCWDVHEGAFLIKVFVEVLLRATFCCSKTLSTLINACLEGMLWRKSRTNLSGIVSSYVRFEFKATIVPIKTWYRKQPYFMLDFSLLMHANPKKYLHGYVYIYIKRTSSEFFIRMKSNINIMWG